MPIQKSKSTGLLPMIVPNTKPAICRSAALIGGDQSAKPKKSEKSEVRKKKRKKVQVGICTANCRYESVRRAARALGFAETDESGDWTIFWTDCSVSLERCLAMKKYQRINHFPGMAEISRKDLLSRNLSRLRKLFPKEYSIFPQTWVLPADQGDLLAYMRGKKRAAFICKPQSGCQGRGIFITRRPTKKMVKSADRLIVQQYIARPLLIDGFKFDLRIYALVTGCDPLRIYVFHEGLVRLATMPYSDPVNSNMDEACMHLTNYAINKHSDKFVRDEESGSKRKFSSLNKTLRSYGYDVDKMWKEIDDCIIKTFISAHPVLQHNYRTCFPPQSHHSACFEILGFDVLIDRKMKVWVLEVNHSPSFQTDSKMDKEIKDQLLIDTFRLLHVRASDKQIALNEHRRITQQRLTQLRKSNTKQSKEKGNEKPQTPPRRPQTRPQTSSSEITRWESKHLGGFRRIYPLAEGEPDIYEKFFENTGSLYQTTASTKAREEAIRVRRMEVETKSKAKELGESTRVRPRSKPRVYLPKKAKYRNEVIPEISADQNQSLPIHIKYEEELERAAQMKNREALVRGLGLVELIYRALHCTSGTIADSSRIQYIEYGNSENILRPCVDMGCPVRREHPLSLSVGGGEYRVTKSTCESTSKTTVQIRKANPQIRVTQSGINNPSVLRQKSFPFIYYPRY